MKLCRVYENEPLVGWVMITDLWTELTGKVLNSVDGELGDNILLELGDEVRYGIKRRNNLV